jgi:hypothetical protein
MTSKSVERLLSISKPILHDTGNEETQYAGVGTCFLAQYGDNGFLVTAKHVLNGYDAESLAVFPNPQTPISIPFNKFVQIANADEHDSDYADITVLRIDRERFDVSPRSEVPALNLSNYDANWHLHKDRGKIIFFGYPTENRGVDYESYLVKSNQQLIEGEYLGPSVSQHCHNVQFDNIGSISSLDGFSGSQVFVLERKITGLNKPHFCGMMIRGTATSKSAIFVDGEVIYKIIRRACKA